LTVDSTVLKEIGSRNYLDTIKKIIYIQQGMERASKQKEYFKEEIE